MDELERILVTPPIRYSRPALQSQIQYLYGAASSADQQVGKDVIARYAELKRELDAFDKQLAEAEAIGK